MISGSKSRLFTLVAVVAAVIAGAVTAFWPTTLATLARALNRLEQSEAEVIPEVVFVSVDPQRDTPVIMKSYVKHFSTRLPQHSISRMD